MEAGAITGYFDVAQIVLYAFWIFFAGLVYYLVQEGKREGYPLESDGSGRVRVQGWPPIPKPKTYHLRDGTTRTSPAFKTSAQGLNASPIGNWPGAPLQPSGDPMLAGVGPGSYSNRPDTPDTTLDGRAKIVPLRAASDFSVAAEDADPRGKLVYGADGQVGGTVVDLWIDRSEVLFRYLEVEVAGAQRRVLLPVNFSRIDDRGVRVSSILGRQFAQAPTTVNPEQVTLLEEEKVVAYYGAGTLYATPSRQEPLL
jgi:photosynthetic reaction center H subunit